MNDFVKTLIDIRKDLKKQVLIIANHRQNHDVPNSTMKSVLNEALELGLKQLINEDIEKETKISILYEGS